MTKAKILADFPDLTADDIKPAWHLPLIDERKTRNDSRT